MLNKHKKDEFVFQDSLYNTLKTLEVGIDSEDDSEMSSWKINLSRAFKQKDKGIGTSSF